jgi:hypothetical protein
VSAEEGAGEATRTLELPGLEAVREKGARAISALLGRESRDGADATEDDPGEVPLAPPRPVTRRSVAAARRTTAHRAPRTRTVRQHSQPVLWAMRIAAVAVLLVLLILLAVLLKVIA